MTHRQIMWIEKSIRQTLRRARADCTRLRIEVGQADASERAEIEAEIRRVEQIATMAAAALKGPTDTASRMLRFIAFLEGLLAMRRDEPL